MSNLPAFIAGAVLSGVAVTGVGMAGATTAHTAPATPPYISHQLAQEDESNGWWNDGTGHPFYAVTVPLYASNGHGNVRRVGKVSCHLYETRRINGSVATLCQSTRPLSVVK